MNKKLVQFREKIAFYLQDSDTAAGKFVELILVGFNLAACALFVVDSYIPGRIPLGFRILEYIIAAEFVLEYVLRVWSSDRKLRYIFSFFGIIDFITIVPSFLPGGKFLRVLKVLRVLRFIRFLEKQSFFFGHLSRFQLQVWRTIFTVFTILFLSAGFIHAAESGVAGAKIKTFGEAFYFCVITLSTVGYGDYFPISSGGQFFNVIMILGGAILIPWQAGKLIRMLISAEAGKKPVKCEKCGLIGHDPDASHCKACGSVIYQEYEGDL